VTHSIHDASLAHVAPARASSLTQEREMSILAGWSLPLFSGEGACRSC
jgi:hypothetical protein